MRLIVAEKPSVALDLARTLGQPQKHEGFVTVGSDTVTWAYGHLVTLADPAQYDPAWKAWAWATLPLLPDPFQLQPIAKSAGQLKIVTRLLQQADRIVCATDGDREGELIFRYIYVHAGVKKPVDRLWLSENTPTAIQKALASMKPLSAYDALAQAAQVRAQADWLIGLNGTRAVTLKHAVPGQGALSVGRVQTPTLRLIADRDQSIAQFQPTPYWQWVVTFHAVAGEYSGTWQAQSGEHPDRILTEADAKALQAKVPGGTLGHIVSLERKRVTVNPPQLFSLTDLQKDANRRLGLTAQQTLDIAQSLYEKHLSSYPRTDARHITGDVAQTVTKRLHGIGTLSDYQGFVHDLPQPLNTTRLVDDKKVAQAGHYAIIPTGQAPSGLSNREQAVFDLIVRRLLAGLMPPGQDERTMIVTEVDGERFRTQGTVLMEAGWRKVLPELQEATGNEEAETETAIPAGLVQGEGVRVKDSRLDSKQTKPPGRLTDASLLALMEKFGLGTPATRARILEVLMLREYVRREKKTLVSTTKGRKLLTVLPERLQSPELTGQWETKLEAIATGQEQTQSFMQGIRAWTQQLVADTQGQTSQAIAASPLGTCPTCHQGQIIAGKKAWGCSRWKEGCHFTIWKTVAGKTLTETQVKTLLEGKTTSVLKGFQSKAGKSFEARLKWDSQSGKVTFVFDGHKAS